ncbi:division/cell wall cluster transcriptional repressor MraZ [Pseudodesulfovibrio sediminis]|uniref:Transcriptional regulator MraZ n=1 Tax=Pseudodesulfovibrio sediminis TaxID=2810563 RepID=A0ABN6ESZ6_9BACT|nr:division/cell wall cluster transcriptional repressor MraZ [Pseudodesulfovibrio sediminis]BCS88345.1 transcriptional regulator MraZ [Pseudodesulfovibrio sediminis]
MLFFGHAHRSLDDKGRLILPPEFRDVIRENVPEGYVVLTIYGNQVIGITPSQWDHAVKEFMSVKAPDNDLEEEMLLFFSCYTKAPVSKQGRIAIPADLRKSGGLEGNVTVLGAGRKFVIRPEDGFDNLLNRKRDISRQLAENNLDLKI